MHYDLLRARRSCGGGPPWLSTVAKVVRDALDEGSRSGLLLDFDGTLAPIVARPDDARLDSIVDEALRRLTTRVQTVAVVSGREVDDLARRVRVPGVWLVGSHGAVIRRPQCGEIRVEVADCLTEELASLSIDLRDLVGVRTERKGTAVAFHYRGLENDRELVAELRARVSAAAKAIGLVVGEGRCVLEIRVPGIDKGSALARIVDESRLDTVVVAGDDWTDLDAFRAVHCHPSCRGIAIAVCSPEMPPPLRTEADVLVANVDELGAWLGSLVAEKP